MTPAELTRIETEILHALLRGKRVSQIAHERARSPKTIETQVRTLRIKAGVNNNAQLGAWAERHGIREAQS